MYTFPSNYHHEEPDQTNASEFKENCKEIFIPLRLYDMFQNYL